MIAPPDPIHSQSRRLVWQMRKHWQSAFRRMRQHANGLGESLPAPVRKVLETPVAYADMMLIDHGIFRLAYLNQHALGSRAYRSAQPAPHDIRRFARQGIRTILNLRGPRDCGGYRLERKTCAAEGIALVDFTLGSRAAPPKASLHAAAELFETIAYPMLMHCKSGADRAGLMAVLYLHWHERLPLREALSQLDWRFGHFRGAPTGILDAFFEQYLAFDAKTPMSLLDWVDRHYDPVALKRDFRPSGLGTLVVDRVLGRE
jgi:protein tyrosine phosphatase (PTP) superfamily phosphohydrolase (DUF442 family)